MNLATKKKIIAYLTTYTTPAKQKLLQEVLAIRTNHVTIALENIYQSHNANAAIRSAECFGIQNVHIIQSQYKFKISSGVAMGSSKWISLHAHPTMQLAFKKLKNDGYRIVAATPHEKAKSLYDLPLKKPLALIFGTENTGLSEYAMNHADEYVKIPMYGFTQSFNVSVSVALCLQYIMTSLHESKIQWQLTEEEKVEILYVWLHKIVRRADLLEREFMKTLV